MEDAVLLLFDIDGTLLRRMPPAHRRAVGDALRVVYGLELTPADMGSTAGMTDTAIARRALLAHGVSDAVIEAGLPAFYAAASAAYTRHVPADLRAYHTPHAAETLVWLAGRGASLGLVTGNIERSAWIKLAAAGLARYFHCGAFGDEAEAREALPPLAVARARQVFACDFAPSETYVIGDTPADIACGAHSGLRTVGVATGPEHTLEHLRACAPDLLFEDLRGLRELEF